MKSGDCELCNKWDSNLIIGMCSQCAKIYNLSIDEMKELQQEIDDEKENANDTLL